MDSIALHQILVFVIFAVICIIGIYISSYYENRQEQEELRRKQEEELKYKQYLEVTHGDPDWIGE